MIVARAPRSAALALVLALVACESSATSQSPPARTAAPTSGALAAPSVPGTASPLVSGLAQCPSVTATGCDRSGLSSPPAGSRGSAACQGRGPALLGASPIDLEEIALIQPMGLMIGGHVTPIDHGYFYVKGAVEDPPRRADVRAPLAGVITSVSRTARQGGIFGDYDDFALTIEATCTFRVRFSNLVDIGGALAQRIGDLRPNQTVIANYAVKERELIGHTGLPTAYGIDVWVENDDVTLTGFIRPDQYESWKTHMVDLFEYTKEPLRSQLLALDMREAAPRWGKIDYDVDGRLVGNWFRRGTGGYFGNKRGGEGYWEGHLAVVYDGLDPATIEISFGDYQGQARQFAVIGNAPDPAAVSSATGVVRYELGQIDLYSADTGRAWGRKFYAPHIRARARAEVVGTVLMQLVDDRTLKVEIFPGKRSAQVVSFDADALLYER